MAGSRKVARNTGAIRGLCKVWNPWPTFRSMVAQRFPKGQARKLGSRKQRVCGRAPYPVRTLRLRLSDEMASSPWAGAESVLQVTLNRLTGYRRSPRGRQRRLIRSTGTLRIRQVDGLNLSTVIVTSPLRTVAIVTRTDFHKISRAAGPKGQVGIAGCRCEHQWFSFAGQFRTTDIGTLSACFICVRIRNRCPSGRTS
jgi:hypothetical protein